ncbi:tRNA1(Val) (adenine(37)-N6)-methyltransferase [Empedobacter sedimenti]|uniref:tRNA1(Val) (adenine(37)-N6)-methyltransferase n=1 Tax=Empedobacter sedimenti TaxID=3042610 RepID=UPI0024A61939|nr:methyltransferase [Empedobacter sedimenti]
MNRKPFQFKQFSIFQDQTAMKVGTDGVLLGAWANVVGQNVLDIGTGTGLISLMIAQRFPKVNIDALEIDIDAFLQAKENFGNSKFNNRLSLFHTSLQNYNSTKKYDLIVSNPPFFTVNDLVSFDSRKQARQQETLTFSDLISKTSQLLDQNGLASFIIPYDQINDFCATASQNELKLGRVVYIKGNEQSAIKRVLLEFSFQEKQLQESHLIIELGRHQYTQDYINLTKEFYLKM